MKSPADVLPDLAGLYADLPVLLRVPDDFTFWCLGRRRSLLARAVLNRFKKARPVLVGATADELYADRAQLDGTPSMGFLRDPAKPGWSTGLPYPVHAIAASFLLSSLEQTARDSLVAEARAGLAADGYLVWADFFLPQTLELQKTYLDEQAARLAGAGLPDEAAGYPRLVREEHGQMVLLENAVSELYDAKFSNIEIIAKRMNVAVIVARK